MAIINIHNWLAGKASEEIEHFLGESPRLCSEGSQIQKLYDLLTDFDFIEAKINHPKFGVQALIEDYDLIDNTKLVSNSIFNHQNIAILRLFQRTLHLSAHILNEDKKQLAAQLVGRMMCFEQTVPIVSNLLSKVMQRNTTWLRPLGACLNLPTGALLAILRGHTDSVRDVTITPDGKQVISCSYDKTIKVWDLKNCSEICTLNVHSDSVRAVSITPDGKLLVSGSCDKTIKIWNLEKYSEVCTLRGHNGWVRSVAITPDSKYIISGSDDNTIKIWNLEKCSEVCTLRGHNGWVRSVAITPDSKYIISASNDKTIKIWDFQNKLHIKTLIGHQKGVVHIAITSDGKRVISASEDKTIKIWNLENTSECRTLTGHENFVYTVAITPDGKKIISGSYDKTIKIWDLETGLELHSFTGHSAHIIDIAITSDGKKLISTSDDNTLKVWSLEEIDSEFPKNIYRNTQVKSLAITPDGKRLIVGSYDKTIKVLDMATQNELFTLNEHSNSVNTVSITQDGKYLISGSDDRTLLVWELRTQRIIAHTSHTYRIHAVAITPDGKYLINAFASNTREASYGLEFLNLETLQKLFGFPASKGDVNALIVTIDGQHLVCASSDKTLKIWNLKTQKYVSTLDGHSSSVNAVAITSDGKYLISASSDRTIKVWDVKTWKECFTLQGHRGTVNAVAIMPDSGYLVSASSDGTLKVWNLSSREVIASYSADDGLECCAVASDGVTIVAGDASRHLHFLCLEGCMNTLPSQTHINSASYPREFQQVILEKSQNFVDCTSIFTVITDFLQRHKRGYFTIVGAPSSGKSSILAKYVTENPNVVYYNAQVEGKNCAEEFLKDVCTQLIKRLGSEDWGLREVSDNVTEGSWFLSLLLQKISDKLEPPQRLIIAIDALDAIDCNSQPIGTNLFYLPRYLPDGVYFLLTRRPFKTEKSGLLIEVPSQILDLSEYSEQNWDDGQAYIQHWQKMKGGGLSVVALKVLRFLTSASNEGMSASGLAEGWCLSTITKIIDEDEVDVEEVLENWLEFLVQQRVGAKTYYSFYHSSFRNWLAGRLSNGEIE